MSIGKGIGYSLFGVAMAAVGTITLVVAAGVGLQFANEKAWGAMFGSKKQSAGE